MSKTTIETSYKLDQMKEIIRRVLDKNPSKGNGAQAFLEEVEGLAGDKDLRLSIEFSEGQIDCIRLIGENGGIELINDASA